MNNHSRNWRRVLIILSAFASLPLIAAAASAQSVQISAPSYGATVKGNITVNCVTSGSQVALVNLFVDSNWLAQSPVYQNSNGFVFSSPWNSATASNGAHTLVCRGYNVLDGTTANTTMGVTVSNIAATATPTA